MSKWSHSIFLAFWATVSGKSNVLLATTNRFDLSDATKLTHLGLISNVDGLRQGDLLQIPGERASVDTETKNSISVMKAHRSGVDFIFTLLGRFVNVCWYADLRS